MDVIIMIRLIPPAPKRGGWLISDGPAARLGKWTLKKKKDTRSLIIYYALHLELGSWCCAGRRSVALRTTHALGSYPTTT